MRDVTPLQTLVLGGSGTCPGMALPHRVPAQLRASVHCPVKWKSELLARPPPTHTGLFWGRVYRGELWRREGDVVGIWGVRRGGCLLDSQLRDGRFGSQCLCVIWVTF